MAQTNKKAFRISQEAERYFRWFLVLVVILAFYAGPFDLLKLCNIKKVEGTLQTTGIVITDGRFMTPKPRLIKLVVNEETYYISHLYIDKEINQATEEIAAYIGEPVSLRYTQNPLNLSSFHNGNIVVDLESKDGELLKNEDMQGVQTHDAIEATLVGALWVVLSFLLFFIATGRIRILKPN